ncbi:MAG: hypothetical protein V3W41_14570 [Planctomycetota bacterium]
MTKKQVVDFFGGTHEHVAIALGIGASAVQAWPDKLTPLLADRAMGAAVRTKGVDAAVKAFPSHTAP